MSRRRFEAALRRIRLGQFSTLLSLIWFRAMARWRSAAQGSPAEKGSKGAILTRVTWNLTYFLQQPLLLLLSTAFLTFELSRACLSQFFYFCREGIESSGSSLLLCWRIQFSSAAYRCLELRQPRRFAQTSTSSFQQQPLSHLTTSCRLRPAHSGECQNPPPRCLARLTPTYGSQSSHSTSKSSHLLNCYIP
jgi:hypothetical protein